VQHRQVKTAQRCWTTLHCGTKDVCRLHGAGREKGRILGMKAVTLKRDWKTPSTNKVRQ